MLFRSGGMDMHREDVFNAAPGEFSEGDFARFTELFGAGENVVRELDLGSNQIANVSS